MRKAEAEAEELKDEIRAIRTKQQEKLEKIAKLTKEEAADKLMKMTERDIRGDMLGLINKLQNEAKETAEDQAAVIITEAMERMASEVTSERTVTAVKLDDEEMKGRIIGKEGRNIQALQRATGVDIMVDDTPGMIILLALTLSAVKLPGLLWRCCLKMAVFTRGVLKKLLRRLKYRFKKKCCMLLRMLPEKLV